MMRFQSTVQTGRRFVVAFDTDKNSVKVIDTMGNSKTYTANNGKVSIELNGAPVFILGVK